MNRRQQGPLQTAWLFLTLCVCVVSAPRLLAKSPKAPPASEKKAACKELAIRFAPPLNLVFERVSKILARRIQERSGIRPVISTAQGSCNVELGLQEGIGNEGFRIEDVAGGVRIVGNDGRGLLYGVGKFLRSNTYHQGSLTLGDWRGTSVPEKPFRGIYFATHFFNWYHEAPVGKIERYVEDLGLWGYNVIIVYFDMHLFGGTQDPAAQAMLGRLNVILRTAKNVGLESGLICVVNEAYQDSPVAMRADWTAGHDGYTSELACHFHKELCPNKPGAKALLLKWRGEVFAAFREVGLNDVVLWPYDSGGCTCSLCKPWGVNGYIDLAESVAELARRNFPQCKIILSTWGFDNFISGEWDGLQARFSQANPKWIDYIMANEEEVKRYSGHPAARRVPGGFRLLSFPEISMWGASPWGGFGANPLPAHHQQLWNAAKDALAGGFPYSEGIFEDLNKVLFAQFFWRKDTPANSIVDEYIAYEFSPNVVPSVRKAIETLEKGYARRGENLEKDAGPVRFVMEQSSGAEEAFKLIEQADKNLTPAEQNRWRWRILYLRALIDSELVKNNYQVSPRCQQAMQELTKIYYAQKAVLPVAPPTKEAIERNRGHDWTSE